MFTCVYSTQVEQFFAENLEKTAKNGMWRTSQNEGKIVYLQNCSSCTFMGVQSFAKEHSITRCVGCVSVCNTINYWTTPPVLYWNELHETYVGT